MTTEANLRSSTVLRARSPRTARPQQELDSQNAVRGGTVAGAARLMGHSGLRSWNRNRIPILFIAVAALAAVSGCSSDDGASQSSKQPPSTPAAHTKPAHSPSSDPNAAQKKAVLAVYDAMSAEQTKAYRKASAKGTELEKYATLEALSKIQLDLSNLKQSGAVVRGEVGHDAEVTKINLGAKTPTATLRDCVDLSNYQTYDTKAKKVIPLPSEQPMHYYASAKAERWSGRWMITDIDTQGGGTC
ncbi:hypothetical protein AB0M68_18935 [Streptomyces sp. NPDC051453]|uniref:hypothetical protein n=1 Tax=Streptomyces sp. NPDC051453 TaxID=3154941 RepID=UPI003412D007